MNIADSLTERAQRISKLPAADAAAELSLASQADIHDILMLLPADQAATIAAHMPGEGLSSPAGSAAVAGQIPGTIGEIMEPAVGLIHASEAAAGIVDEMVHTEAVSEITYLYVIEEPDDRLVGVVNLRDLILARPGEPVTEIMVREPFAFRADTSFAEAVTAALKRHYPVYPVVDDAGRVIGLVRGWRVFERVASELATQAGSMVGVERTERISTPVMTALRHRHPWLQVNLITAFAAAFVVSQFEDTITRIVALAAFLPVLAGQSGNTGCQALAITLRGMTLGELNDYPLFRVLRKEVILGAINGFLVGLVAALAMWVYAAQTGAAEPAMLALVILIAMIGACIGSGIFGVLVPVALKRFGADPATASSIFLTTFTDIIGMGLMLLLATTLVL